MVLQVCRVKRRLKFLRTFNTVRLACMINNNNKHSTAYRKVATADGVTHWLNLEVYLLIIKRSPLPFPGRPLSSTKVSKLLTEVFYLMKVHCRRGGAVSLDTIHATSEYQAVVNAIEANWKFAQPVHWYTQE